MTVSERSRGPEGASSPSTTQSSPSAGDDIYAAAAASAAGRTARRGGANRPARSAGSAPETEADSTTTAARARTNGQDSSTGAARDSKVGSDKSAGNGSAAPSDAKNAAGTKAAGDAKGPAAKTADSESSTESTSKFGAVASSVLNRVRPGSKDGADTQSPNKGNSDKPGSNKPAAGPSASSPSSAPQGTSAGSKPSGKSTAGQATGTSTNTAQTTTAAATGAAVGTSATGSADPAAEPTTALPREQVLPTATKTAEPAKAEKHKAGTAKGTRKARLRLSRLDPWSVMKTAFLFSIAAGIVMVVAVYAVWLVIGSSGLFSSLDSIVGSVLQSPGDTTPFKIEDYINTQKVMGVTAFLACIDVVIFTALATLASFLYNLAATMLGGLEVTLAED